MLVGGVTWVLDRTYDRRVAKLCLLSHDSNNFEYRNRKYCYYISYYHLWYLYVKDECRIVPEKHLSKSKKAVMKCDLGDWVYVSYIILKSLLSCAEVI
jgi:hypothetical protein